MKARTEIDPFQPKQGTATGTNSPGPTAVESGDHWLSLALADVLRQSGVFRTSVKELFGGYQLLTDPPVWVTWVPAPWAIPRTMQRNCDAARLANRYVWSGGLKMCA